METTEETTVTPPDTAGADTPDQTPEERGRLAALKAEREKRQAAEARLAELERKAAEAEEAEALKRGEHERLFREAKERADRLEAEAAEYRAEKATRLAALDASNADRTAKLPEHLRGLVPDGLTGEALATHLSRLEQVNTAAAPPVIPIGGRGTGTGVDPEELTPEIQRWLDSPDGQHLRGVSPRVVRQHYNKLGPGKVTT